MNRRAASSAGLIVTMVAFIVVLLFGFFMAYVMVPPSPHVTSASCTAALDCTITVDNPTQDPFVLNGGAEISFPGTELTGQCTGHVIPSDGTGAVTCQFGQGQQLCGSCIEGQSATIHVFYGGSSSVTADVVIGKR